MPSATAVHGAAPQIGQRIRAAGLPLRRRRGGQRRRPSAINEARRLAERQGQQPARRRAAARTPRAWPRRSSACPASCAATTARSPPATSASSRSPRRARRWRAPSACRSSIRAGPQRGGRGRGQRRRVAARGPGRIPRRRCRGRSTLAAVCAWLDARRLVTTELYVIPPTYRKVAVAVGLHVKAGYGVDAVRRWVELVLRQYLAPLPPYGPAGDGWPLGRRVHGPELEAAALQVEGVEWLEGLVVAGTDDDGVTWTVPGPIVARALRGRRNWPRSASSKGPPGVPGAELGPAPTAADADPGARPARGVLMRPFARAADARPVGACLARRHRDRRGQRRRRAGPAGRRTLARHGAARRARRAGLRQRLPAVPQRSRARPGGARGVGTRCPAGACRGGPAAARPARRTCPLRGAISAPRPAWGPGRCARRAGSPSMIATVSSSPRAGGPRARLRPVVTGAAAPHRARADAPRRPRGVWRRRPVRHRHGPALAAQRARGAGGAGRRRRGAARSASPSARADASRCCARMAPSRRATRA